MWKSLFLLFVLGTLSLIVLPAETVNRSSEQSAGNSYAKSYSSSSSKKNKKSIEHTTEAPNSEEDDYYESEEEILTTRKYKNVKSSTAPISEEIDEIDYSNEEESECGEDIVSICSNDCQKKECTEIKGQYKCNKFLKCVKECICRDGYLLNEDDKCVPLHECEEKQSKLEVEESEENYSYTDNDETKTDEEVYKYGKAQEIRKAKFLFGSTTEDDYEISDLYLNAGEQENEEKIDEKNIGKEIAAIRAKNLEVQSNKEDIEWKEEDENEKEDYKKYIEDLVGEEIVSSESVVADEEGDNNDEKHIDKRGPNEEKPEDKEKREREENKFNGNKKQNLDSEENENTGEKKKDQNKNNKKKTDTNDQVRNEIKNGKETGGSETKQERRNEKIQEKERLKESENNETGKFETTTSSEASHLSTTASKEGSNNTEKDNITSKYSDIDHMKSTIHSTSKDDTTTMKQIEITTHPDVYRQSTTSSILNENILTTTEKSKIWNTTNTKESTKPLFAKDVMTTVKKLETITNSVVYVKTTPIAATDNTITAIENLDTTTKSAELYETSSTQRVKENTTVPETTIKKSSSTTDNSSATVTQPTTIFDTIMMTTGTNTIELTTKRMESLTLKENKKAEQYDVTTKSTKEQEPLTVKESTEINFTSTNMFTPTTKPTSVTEKYHTEITTPSREYKKTNNYDETKKQEPLKVTEDPKKINSSLFIGPEKYHTESTTLSKETTMKNMTGPKMKNMIPHLEMPVHIAQSLTNITTVEKPESTVSSTKEPEIKMSTLKSTGQHHQKETTDKVHR